MHVAELSLCKELYELSGWRDTSEFYVNGMLQHGIDTAFEDHAIKTNYPGYSPAYSLGYLLRRLPEFIDWKELQHNLSLYPSGVLGGWVAKYENAPLKTAFQVVADTPENAAAKLCIALFKQKILTRES